MRGRYGEASADWRRTPLPSALREFRKVAKGTFQCHFFGIKFLFVNTLAYDWPLLTKKKSANLIANACPKFEATRTAAA